MDDPQVLALETLYGRSDHELNDAYALIEAHRRSCREPDCETCRRSETWLAKNRKHAIISAEAHK